ncbi:cysteine--tRNA ligase [Pseudoclavibacter helvolus]|uniref:cysteine--tRNA ligase n=1 Tax=Pseudoclavibacter helvolus TaxID=255205 RepID=UPI003C764FFA
MNQRIYDTQTQALGEFTPMVPGEVSMYVCGPTVQSAPHAGHLRSALVYDQFRSWFEANGLRVTLVRNVTDIDDKTLAGATDAEPWWALAYRVEREFNAAYSALGIRPPTYEPRATASIPEMQELIALLIERGHAYPAADDSGDVWFDTGSWPSYGELTHQRPEDMAEGEAPSRGKRSAADFALWKGRKPGEPDSAAWASPWGSGRPGWHIECSAMSTKYLGPTFDIHGGGRDLRFPHHENELAQSRAAGLEFARTWVHNGLVSVAGQKMSKSIGNTVSALDLLSAARPIVVRYFLGSAHYRSTIEIGETSLEEAAASFARIEAFLERAERAGAAAGAGAQQAPALDDLPIAFVEAMNDDFAVPQALASLHETVTRGNQAFDVDATDQAARAAHEVVSMLDILGINPRSEQWRDGADSSADAALAAIVDALLAERTQARGAKDFARADQIRDTLAAAGVQIEDSPKGSFWTLEKA